jgi:hypothetical protein
LVFNLVALRIGQAVVDQVTVDGQAARWSSHDQTLTVDLPNGLAASGQTAVRIRYSAVLEPAQDDRNGFFGKVGATVNMARWIPWLSRPVEFSRPTFGNPFVTASAARVDVRLTSDVPLVYATSGERTSVSADGLTQAFVAHNVRDFNLAAAPDFQQTTIEVRGTPITFFHRTLPADRVLLWAERAFDYYSEHVGAYAWPSLAIAETTSQMGLESPALVWIPDDTRGARIRYLVAHEIAHQWFYAAVGNDQASEPFADEAPSEFLARSVTGTLRASRCPDDELDRSIYEYTDECYFETIYVQGANYLDAFRRAVGDAVFWRGMSRYYADHRFGMGGTRALLDALDFAAGRDPAHHRARFPSLYQGPEPDTTVTVGARARLFWLGVLLE